MAFELGQYRNNFTRRSRRRLGRWHSKISGLHKFWLETHMSFLLRAKKN